MYIQSHLKISSKLGNCTLYLYSNATSGITAADVFAHVGLSHTTVGSMFRRKLGVSVQDRLASVRMEEACHLLGNGMSVTEVALKSGFSSVQYFCRAFAAAHGVSPAAWQSANTKW